jgi:hypothetical protein
MLKRLRSGPFWMIFTNKQQFGTTKEDFTMIQTINNLLIILLAISMGCLSCQKKKDPISQSKNPIAETSNKSGTNAWTKPSSIPVTCDDYGTIQTKQGILTNNVWNKKAAGHKKWSQCIVKKMEGDSIVYGWSWSWPKGKRVIYGYPQIKVGASPWAPEPKFDDRFPMDLSQLEQLDVSIDVETSSNGNYNLATSMWLIREPNPSSQPNQSIIAAEVMFWTYATEGQFNPAGRKYGEVTVAGESWEIWYEKNWSDASGVNKNRWVYISFKAKNQAFKTTIHALELLRYAIQEELISDSLWIADIELGNEVMAGEGTTWVKDFHVQSALK